MPAYSRIAQNINFRMVIIIKKAIRLLREKRGMSAFIELAVLILIILMFLALSISFLNIYARNNIVNTMAHEMARYISIRGEIGGGTYAEFERLKVVSGFSTATVSFNRPNGPIPLEEPFTVTVTVVERFGIGTIQVIPVTVRGVSTGRSEVFWK